MLFTGSSLAMLSTTKKVVGKKRKKETKEERPKSIDL
jgi:hypothetical protein